MEKGLLPDLRQINSNVLRLVPGTFWFTKETPTFPSETAATWPQEERWGESVRLLRTWAPVGTARPAGQGRGTACPRGTHHPATHIPKRISRSDPRPTASPDPDPAARSPGAATRGRSRPRSSSASAAQRAMVRPTRAGTVPESSARAKAAGQNLPHWPGGAEPAEDSKRLGEWSSPASSARAAPAPPHPGLHVHTEGAATPGPGEGAGEGPRGGGGGGVPGRGRRRGPGEGPRGGGGRR